MAPKPAPAKRSGAPRRAPGAVSAPIPAAAPAPVIPVPVVTAPAVTVPKVPKPPTFSIPFVPTEAAAKAIRAFVGVDLDVPRLKVGETPHDHGAAAFARNWLENRVYKTVQPLAKAGVVSVGCNVPRNLGHKLKGTGDRACLTTALVPWKEPSDSLRASKRQDFFESLTPADRVIVNSVVDTRDLKEYIATAKVAPSYYELTHVYLANAKEEILAAVHHAERGVYLICFTHDGMSGSYVHGEDSWERRPDGKVFHEVGKQQYVHESYAWLESSNYFNIGKRAMTWERCGSCLGQSIWRFVRTEEVLNLTTVNEEQALDGRTGYGRTLECREIQHTPKMSVTWYSTPAGIWVSGVAKTELPLPRGFVQKIRAMRLVLGSSDKDWEVLLSKANTEVCVPDYGIPAGIRADAVLAAVCFAFYGCAADAAAARLAGELVQAKEIELQRKHADERARLVRLARWQRRITTVVKFFWSYRALMLTLALCYVFARGLPWKAWMEDALKRFGYYVEVELPECSLYDVRCWVDTAAAAARVVNPFAWRPVAASAVLNGIKLARYLDPLLFAAYTVGVGCLAELWPVVVPILAVIVAPFCEEWFVRRIRWKWVILFGAAESVQFGLSLGGVLSGVAHTGLWVARRGCPMRWAILVHAIHNGLWLLGMSYWMTFLVHVAVLWWFGWETDPIITCAVPRVSHCVGRRALNMREGVSFKVRGDSTLYQGQCIPPYDNCRPTNCGWTAGPRLAGFNIVVSRPCRCNAIAAVGLRTLAVRPVNDLAVVMSLVLRDTFVFMGEQFKAKPLVTTFAQWVQRFPKARRLLHEAAREDSRTITIGMEASIEGFVKQENLFKAVGPFVEPYAPRPIQGRTSKYCVRFGPIAYQATQRCMEMWGPDKGSLFFTAGQTGEGVGKWFDRALSELGELGPVHALEFDFKNFDASRSLIMLELGVQFMLDSKLIDARKAGEMRLYIKMNATKRGTMGADVKFSSDADGASGDPFTALLNTIVLFALVLTIFRYVTGWSYEKIIKHMRAAGLGDDGAIPCTQYLAGACQEASVAEAAAALGYKLSYFARYADPEMVSFCSQRFWPTADGHVLGPKPGRKLSKMFWAVNVPRRDLPQWISDVVACCKNEASYAPVLNELYPAMAKLTTKPGRVLDEHKVFNAQQHLATNATDVFFYKVYGVRRETLEDLRQLELRADTVIDHPVVRHVAEVDWSDTPLATHY